MLASSCSSRRLLPLAHQAGRRLMASTTWSGSLSFASPEADFSAGDTASTTFQARSFFSATNHQQRDFSSSFITAGTASQESSWWSNTLSFASPESDFTSPETLVQQQHQAQQQQYYPETLAEALVSKFACVVTQSTAPHTIVAVNAAWESLCGYSAHEVMGQPSLAMLQGVDTNTTLTAATVQQAIHHATQQQQQQQQQQQWADMYVVNYKKNGHPFINHVSMKEVALNHAQPDVRFLLGVLEPVERAPLRMVY